MQRKAVEQRYTFSPLLEIEKDIRPGSKDKRIISISSIRDTIVQTALVRLSLSLSRSPPCRLRSLDIEKGRNAHTAVRRIQDDFAAGRTFVFDADFSKFFSIR